LGTLATEIRNRLGCCPELADPPLVSIVVLNRNGIEHLRRLLAGLIEHTDYPRFELIVVDNASSDGSLDFIRRAPAPFPVSIVANAHNESFSDANNQGAELASGELLLLLNNDIEPFDDGWLHELVACQRRSGAGAVAGTLTNPIANEKAVSDYRVQSGPVKLRAVGEGLSVESNFGRRKLFGETFGQDVESVVAFGACLLIERERFEAVGGMTHGYFYGGEDEDLCLKLRERGSSVLYCGRSILFHHSKATSRALHDEAAGELRRGNSLLLATRWGARAWREYHLDLLDGTHVWAAPDAEPMGRFSREEVLALGFCLMADSLSAEAIHSLSALEPELERGRHRCLVLRDDSIDDPRGAYYDVNVHLRGAARYLPRPHRLNVLWSVDRLDALSGIECDRYDLVVTSDAEQARRLRAESHSTLVAALDPDRPAASLVDAVLNRAEQLRFPTRIAPDGR
jgi:GT2 family glycosyltransferase